MVDTTLPRILEIDGDHRIFEKLELNDFFSNRFLGFLKLNCRFLDSSRSRLYLLPEKINFDRNRLDHHFHNTVLKNFPPKCDHL